MSRAFHEACNTALRTAMADLFDFGDGWTLVGCLSNGATMGWMALPGLTQAVTTAGNQFVGDAGIELPPVMTAGYEDPTPEQMQDLRGLAEVHFSTDDQGRFGIAKAVFDDAWRHTVSWRAAEAAPVWELTSPPEAAASANSGDQILTGLLSGVLDALGLARRLVSEEERALSTCLRDFIAEMTGKGCHAVFVIVHTEDGWEAIPANNLAAFVGTALGCGANLADAVGQLAVELEADPPATIPTLQGVGTLVHYDHEDGSTEAQLVAVGDQFVHAASWIHGHERPDWQILPISEAEADLEYAPMTEAYTRLLTAIRGTRH